MTDPQDDVPCRDCKRPTQHDTERCDDCRTPAGRLVTALMDLNIDAEIDGRFVNVGCLIVDTNDEGMWSIDGHEEDGITAADAIAAIVQAPGLRSENAALAAEVKRLRDALADRTQGQTIAETAADVQRSEVERLREELEKPVAGAWQWNSGANTESRFGLDGRKIATVYEGGAHWCDHMNDKTIREGGKHAADPALLAAGYRLVGGVHPLPAETPYDRAVAEEAASMEDRYWHHGEPVEVSDES